MKTSGGIRVACAAVLLAGTVTAQTPPTFEQVKAWVTAYKAAHPGGNGKDADINGKTPEQIAADPAAKQLLSVCGPGQRPVIPMLAWEYGGADHPWMKPEGSALVYCVYTPVARATANWRYDAARRRVVADVYVKFPDQNPCKARRGKDQVLGCIGDATNLEILVDTASWNDGKDAGLDLAEASTELRLMLPDGAKVTLTIDSIAAQLGEYTLAFSRTLGYVGANLSGITFSPATNTFFLIENGKSQIFEMNGQGGLVRRIATSGLSDCEGISHESGNTFFVAEERRMNVKRIQIPASGVVDGRAAAATKIDKGAGNLGLEGVAFSAADKAVYAVKEMAPKRLYKVSLASNRVQPDYPFSLEAVSEAADVSDLFVLPDGLFLILSDESSVLLGLDVTGKVLSRLPIRGVTRPEGITLDSEGRIYVASEPNSLNVYEIRK